MTPEDLIDSLQWRYATKVFDAEKTIPAETWANIEQSMVLTPSSFGLQPWKFVTITCPETKAALLEHSWHQQQVVDCSHMVVLCARDGMSQEDVEKWLNRLCETRGISRESLQGYAGMMSGFFGSMDDSQTLAWAKNQVYIALGQLMTSAAVLGIDACPMEGIVPVKYDQILGLENSGYVTTVACAMGYRASEDKYAQLPKVRYEASEIIERIES
ncbi:MAG: NAD(P)H-dependent oxidoreductase [Verrucomicrobiae bacterium]|nr:NAD(P)H-dependent oxidoreductase [Verrucomicrobiae bacterium]NNJ87636.1 NAD(P)H-dependent oxidoreductase [Akkermansiaceae bacterium]